MKESLIIINATATKHGGALTILKDFISAIKDVENKSRFIIFTGIEISDCMHENISIIKIKTNGFGIGGIKRVLWDFAGLYLYCKKNDLKPDLVISFQNSGVFFPNIHQLIYYHQLLSLYTYNWKFYRRDEFLMFFYERIYPVFIKLSLTKRTEIVVQQIFLKKLFCEKFGVDESLVHVVIPDIKLKIDSTVEKLNLDQGKFHLFYPTDWPKHKNYSILFKAISIIRAKAPSLADQVMLHITIDRSEGDKCKDFSKMHIDSNVNFLGRINYQNVISYYRSVDLLVFPSFMETIGLPLIEAASFGLPILVSDLEYAHTTLSDYSGAYYVKFDDPEKWSESIVDIYKRRPSYIPLKSNSGNHSWERFLELCEKIITSD